mgnify:FL=1
MSWEHLLFLNREGWLYLAVLLDLYSSQVIRWSVSNYIKQYLTIRALDITFAS